MRHKNRYKIVQIYEEMDQKIRSGSILLSVPKGYTQGQATVSPWSQHHNPSAVLSHIEHTPTSTEPLWFLVIYYPAYSTFSPIAMESRCVTILQYDLTSSEDEKDSDQNVCVFIVEAFSTQCFRIPLWTASRGGSKRPQWTEQRLGPGVRQRRWRGRSFYVCK